MGIDIDVAAVEEEQAPPPITKADLQDVFDAVAPAARYIYIGKNANRFESKPERALVHVGAVATYFNQFGGLSNEDTRAVQAAVETNLRVIEAQFPPDSDGGFEYLKKRDALYDEAVAMTKTPDSSPSPMRAGSDDPPSTPRVKRASELDITPSSLRRKPMLSFGMMANNNNDNNQAAANDRVQGRARRRFVPLDQAVMIPGAGPQIQAAIKVKFDEFVNDTLSEYGPSTLITLAHAAAIASLASIGGPATWGLVAGAAHAGDYARRHYRKKRKTAQRNAQRADEPLFEVAAEGWHSTRRVGAVAVGTGVGTAWLAQNQRETSWITRWFGKDVYTASVGAAHAGARSTVATEHQLVQHWANLSQNRVLTFIPELMAKYPKFFSTVGTGIGLAMIAKNYYEIEQQYEADRWHGWLAKNSVPNAESWETELQTYLASIQENGKRRRKKQIEGRLVRVMDWRKNPPENGNTMTEHVHAFIDRMETVQDRIVALLQEAPAEYDEVVNPDPYALGAPPGAAMAAAAAAGAGAGLAGMPPLAPVPPGGAAGAPVVEKVFAQLHRMRLR